MLLIVLCGFGTASRGQLTVTGGYTAAQLATKLAGPGVTVSGASLTCASNAYGEFVVISSTLGLDSGIVLTTGTAATSGLTYGVDGPATDFASTDNGTPGDASLNSLLTGGVTTHDACILQFDFAPDGDTVRFNYVFGSEEYNGFVCSPYDDVFGFFISGGAYATPTNIAIIPGTTIPVSINSVNCGASAGYPLSTCTSLGPGSPFCAYYVNNTGGTTVTYDGLTTVLTATAVVSPCNTYHLKLGVADASDGVYDSGVFLAAGSLTSTPPVAISGVGVSGLPYCVRGCADGTFEFSTPSPHDTPIVVHYVITGTAVNGYDYSTIPDSAIIAPGSPSTVLTINPLIVPPAGPKVVTLEIMVPNPCDPSTFTIGGVSTLTILDSFSYQILTPDTTICLGEYVHAVAVGDTTFSNILHYTWSPTAGVSNDTTLTTNITPTTTTTYTLTLSTIAAVGCPDQHESFTIEVDHPLLAVATYSNPSVCGYYDGSIELSGLIPGLNDTLYYTRNGASQPAAPITISPTGTYTMTNLGAAVYSNIYIKANSCYTNSVDVTLVNPPKPTVTVDSADVYTCMGIPMQLHAYVTVSPTSTPIYYLWQSPTWLNSTTIADPIVTPTDSGSNQYHVIISPDTVSACWDTAILRVHAVRDFVLNTPNDTICMGQSIHVSISGSDSINYSWSPTDGVVTATTKNPVITPTQPCVTTYVVTGTYHSCPPYVHSFFTEVDTPAHIRNIIDTTCLGIADTFNLTVANSDSACNYYTYSWYPTAGVSDPTSPNPSVDPPASGTYIVTISPHAGGCAINDNIYINVLPNHIVVSPIDTSICRGRGPIQIVGTGDPAFSYQWLPTTGIGVSNVLNALLNPDTTVDYVVTASFHKCPDMYAYVHLDVQPNPTVYIGGNRFVCIFDTIHIAASVTPPYAYYSYAWSPAAGLDNTTSGTVVYSGTTGEEVYVTVTTPAGCTGIDSAYINVNTGPGTSFVANMDFCPHDSAVLTPTPATASFHWYPPVYLSDSLSASPMIHPITTTVYTVVGTSVQGCSDTAIFTATVHPSAVMLMPDSVVIYPGDSYNIEPTTNCITFNWFPPTGLSSTIISNPVATPEISTKYVVTASTEWGCTVIDSINIIVDGSSVMAIPNAFTPGNGVNSEFKIINQGIASLNYFRIFNRWGNLVFETKDISEGWDGTFKGQAQPFGVYVYEIQGVTTNGAVINKKGNITLIR